MAGILNEKIKTHSDGSVERWRDIPGYEGFYRVSDWGRVKTVKRYSRHPKGGMRIVQSRILKSWIVWSRKGRNRKIRALQVSFSCKGVVEAKQIHPLVLLAFVGPRPDGMDCCHNDGDPTNNRLDNLRWDTRSGNEADKRIHGTDNRAENIRGVNRWTGVGCFKKRKI